MPPRSSRDGTDRTREEGEGLTDAVRTADPVALGVHAPIHLGEAGPASLSWACSNCGKRAESKDNLMRSGCEGQPPAVRTSHESHKLFMSGQFVWCAACGGHGIVLTEKLRAKCQPEHVSKSAKDRLNRLRAGKNPRDCSFVGFPIKLTREPEVYRPS